MSLCDDLDSILLCHIYCAPPGHFLFLQVSERNSLREASIQSSYFPAPVSTAACQVSYSDRQSHLMCFCFLLLVWHQIVQSMMPTPCWNCVCFSVQMRFSLYLYGDFNGSLLVAIEENGTNSAPLVWERNGQWTDDWEEVALQLTGLQHGYIRKKKRIEVDDHASEVLQHKYQAWSHVY